ncbi:hypothetical protein [Hymenobacter ruricola]|uniref:Alpha/beta hydrolase n=1 Tax=Hymenobacter ruricola TaxID=2791023 RepID=A0ABS0I3V0_9BACT|nr:hypothetical protein [Hymenobacter ruricola]MBF9221466.1 hypothetical protein [Hymenobacter ruricola]
MKPSQGKQNRAEVNGAVTQIYSLKPLAVPELVGATNGQLPVVALVLCHGMGQQVRHETLAEAANNLHHSRAEKAVVRYVQFADPDRPGKGDPLLPRAEIEVEVPSREGQPAARQFVHVYEVYWAPLTEGMIGLTDVVRFLTSAGVQGLRYARNQFPRWLFGKEESLDVKPNTFWQLAGLLALVLSLVLINTVMTLVLGENLFGTNASRTAPPELINRLTTCLTVLLVAGGFVYLSIRRCNKQQRKPTQQPGAVRWAWVFLGLLCLLLVASAGFMGWSYVALHRAAAQPDTHEPWLSGRSVWVVLVWAAAVTVSWWCRGFLVQYLGDVAIYTDAYKVDKYYTIRTRIRRLAQRTVEAVYGARVEGAAGPFYYQRVVMAAHSLGSLVAYDALNAILLADEAAGGGLRVPARTGALVTYGSPLDKTTFLFHAKSQKTAIYTALDSSRQPLVWDAAARRAVQWVNLHSTADIISGALDYFDSPASRAAGTPPVLNCPDPDAFTPVYAHTQYWNGWVLSKALRLALSGHTISVGDLALRDAEANPLPSAGA